MNVGGIGPTPPAGPVGAPAPAAPAEPPQAPTGGPAPPAAAEDGVALSQPGWPPASPAFQDDDWPTYPALFGQAAYVKDPADAKLLDLMRAALEAEPELAKPPLGPAVAAGKIDAASVKALQEVLKARGLDLGPAGVDGKFGPKTHAALIAMLEGAEGPPAPTGPKAAGPTPPAPPAPPATPAPTKPPAKPPTAGPAQVTGTAFDPSYKLGDPPPAGYQAMRGAVPAGVGQMAKSLLGQPHGTATYFELDGKRYVARNEPHYHPPGFKGGPNGWHTGVTVYEAK